ncbi:hypothetical protein [Paenibacillus agricola]|uniref:Uncharacterized protein n=1 Tax=Paenibacillus agricola TaxID=2716264 RepID=A0ABX0JDF8_9BACL|nr:hypothetical protein [Paenibacillus agricola]NHN34520.1 hypothetical protein [Paenibacillus agricola]
MEQSEQTINRIKEELEKQQEENAMMAYEHENGRVLNDEERKILEREYEPRFDVIYPNYIINLIQSILKFGRIRLKQS